MWGGKQPSSPHASPDVGPPAPLDIPVEVGGQSKEPSVQVDSVIGEFWEANGQGFAAIAGRHGNRGRGRGMWLSAEESRGLDSEGRIIPDCKQFRAVLR